MDQTVVFITLGIALAMFTLGRIRYDLVAMMALLFLTVWGIIPADLAFRGFAHPAVITVAAVLVVSRAMQNSGVIVVVARLLYKLGDKKTLQIATLCLITAIASGFMNNIGALAILMPVAISMAKKGEYPPSHILMPVAFASILGGMMTMIGTPPNIIIATYRSEEIDKSTFSMFDFMPVGGLVALAGVVLISLAGWRFMPKRKPNASDEDLYEVENYITELTITEKSKLQGITAGQIKTITTAEAEIIGLIRGQEHQTKIASDEMLHANDVLVIKATAHELNTFAILTKAEFTGACDIAPDKKDKDSENEVETVEVIIQNNSPLIGNSVADLRMRQRYGVNLLAVSSHNADSSKRLNQISFEKGDVLMLQGERRALQEAMEKMKCLPLANRGVNLGKPRKMILTVAIFSLAIVAVILDLVPVEIAFTIAAVFMVLTRQIPLADLYTSIDWPVIVLLAAMIPVGMAFETSGGADMVTDLISGLGGDFPAWLLIGILMVITLLLSNVINNAATAVLMAPVAVKLAEDIDASTAPFLMAVAVAASCAFLTPIGHQSNTLVMRPAGYRFSDYWKLGVLVTIIILALGIPLILYFWPL